MKKPSPPLGLYLHIPFCKSKCLYCDFYSLPQREEKMDEYTEVLLRHLEEMAPRAAGHRIDTVYFGGGTPSYLGVRRLEKLLKCLKKRYPLEKDAELTLEAFTSIAFVMTVGIIWGMALMLTLGKTYCNRITRSNKKSKGGRSFADVAMTAMFVGLISAYLGSYIAQMVQVGGGGLVFTGNILPLVTAGFSALAMALMNYLVVKKKQGWWRTSPLPEVCLSA